MIVTDSPSLSQTFSDGSKNYVVVATFEPPVSGEYVVSVKTDGATVIVAPSLTAVAKALPWLALIGLGALLALGVRSVIAPSFGDIHYGNQLQNGMLPVTLPDEICQKLRQQLHASPGAQLTVDLESQTVTGPDGTAYRFDIDPNHRERLLKGLDDIALVMQNIDATERPKLGEEVVEVAIAALAQDKKALIAEKRREPDSLLVSELVRVEDGGTVGYGGFGTAAGVVALASVGVGVGTYSTTTSW